MQRTFWLVLFLFISACASIDPDALKVNLSRLQLLDSTLMEQRFRAVLRIQNRSRKTLQIEGLSFDLSLNGQAFASGVSHRKLTIEPLSEALVSIDLSSTLLSWVRQFQSLQSLQTRPFSYDFTGHLYLENSPTGLHFQERGEIALTATANSTDSR